MLILRHHAKPCPLRVYHFCFYYYYYYQCKPLSESDLNHRRHVHDIESQGLWYSLSLTRPFWLSIRVRAHTRNIIYTPVHGASTRFINLAGNPLAARRPETVTVSRSRHFWRNKCPVPIPRFRGRRSRTAAVREKVTTAQLSEVRFTWKHTTIIVYPLCFSFFFSFSTPLTHTRRNQTTVFFHVPVWRSKKHYLYLSTVFSIRKHKRPRPVFVFFSLRRHRRVIHITETDADDFKSVVISRTETHKTR